MDISEDISVKTIRNYLRIKTVHPNPDYMTCVKFLVDLAKDIGLDVDVIEPCTGKPVVIMTWLGREMCLPSLFLYSHTDVVPVSEDKWICDPFSGYKDEEGRIFGRGAQDMKSTGIQYVEAIRRLKLVHKSFLRTVHVVFGPDEEVGGRDGMGKLVELPLFQHLNVGFALDEGTICEDDTYIIANGQRCNRSVKVVCSGNTGHGSKFIDNTAGEKMRKILNFMLDYREDLKTNRLGAHKEYLVTINLTKIQGGIQRNVVPAEMTAYFDIRLSPYADFDAFQAKLEEFEREAGPGVRFEFLRNKFVKRVTPLENSNPWWTAMKSVFDKLGLKYRTGILSGGSDSGFLREKGYHCLNFTPIVNTPVLEHADNEYISEKVFLDGLKIYTELIPALANLPGNSSDNISC